MLRQCCCSCCILIVILSVLTFTAWFVVRQFSPSKPIIYTVTDAMVTQFNLTAANTTLEYNLFVNMTVENPNKWSDFHYEYFDAVSSYKNLELSRKVLEPFGVGHKNDYALTPAFIGRLPVALPNEEVVSIRNGSVFDIVLRIHFKLFTKIGKFKTERDGQMACYLKVPFSIGGKSAAKFESTKCVKP